MHHPAAGCLACLGSVLIGAIVSILGGWRAAAFAALAICAGIYASIQTVRLHALQLSVATMQRDAAQAQCNAEAKARKAEQTMAQAVADAAAQYERGKQDAQATADAVTADLRAGSLRLRREWAGCETRRLSAAAAATRELETTAASRDALAAAIVPVGAECDAKERELIAAYQGVREVVNGISK